MSTSEKVKQFHEFYGQVIRTTPNVDVPEKQLRLDLIIEEVGELADAILAVDFVAILDALGDIEYVVHGAAITFGIDLDLALQSTDVLAPLDHEVAYLAKALEDNSVEGVTTSLANISAQVRSTCKSHLGIDLSDVVDVIHKSNMSKMGADGKPVYNEAGKVIKGPNYHTPTEDIKRILAESDRSLELIGV